MNKKTVLSALLCCALLSTATSCNRSDGIRSDNATDDQFLEEAASLNERTEEDASEKVMFHDYDDILERYRILLSNECNDGDSRTADECLDPNDHAIETTLRSLVINSYADPNRMGYAIHDINGDTQTELILMDDQYHIYAVFTQINEIPVLLDWFGLNNHYASLDQNGIICKTGYGKGENSYTKIMQITHRGELEILLEYGYDDAASEYYIMENHGKRVAERQDITALADLYAAFLQDPSATTKKSGILFVPAINP